LNLSKRTVEHHLSEIKHKLQCETNSQIIKAARAYLIAEITME